MYSCITKACFIHRISVASNAIQTIDNEANKGYHLVTGLTTWGGYNLLRRDRIVRKHGGVCMYIRDSIQYSLLNELIDASFELWIKVILCRLPRGFSSIIVGTVNHLPGSDNPAMLNYLMNCLSSIESRYPHCGILLLGGFTKLKSKIQFQAHFTNESSNFQLELKIS